MRKRSGLRARGWGVAASALFHVLLFGLLAWSLKDRLHLPREAPIRVELVRLPMVERTTARPPPGVRPRPALLRPKDAAKVVPLPIPPAPPAPQPVVGPAAPPPPKEVQFRPPRPILKGLAGCTDDPVRNPDLQPCFDGTVQAQAEAPAYRMAGEKVRAWDTAMARQKAPPRNPIDACPPDGQASRLGFGCLPPKSPQP